MDGRTPQLFPSLSTNTHSPTPPSRPHTHAHAHAHAHPHPQADREELSGVDVRLGGRLDGLEGALLKGLRAISDKVREGG